MLLYLIYKLCQALSLCLNLKSKNPILKKRIRFFEVDPAGIAPASSDVKANMLTRYNTGPGPYLL